MPNVNFALPSNSKDQLRDLYDYSDQKVIAAINILDGSTLGNSLLTSHQVDYKRSFQLKLLKMNKSICA